MRQKKEVLVFFVGVIIFLSIFGLEQQASAEENQPDYTSKVPQFIFANTLQGQQKQLQANPMMERFAKSRKNMAGDRYRPIYHYVNPENSLNDGNGLCFWKGRWHLFYQGYPPEDPRQHWGHAVSDDLIHWRDLPYAIYPNPEHHCFSGSTLVEEDRVIAMYFGTYAGEMVAVSNDPLLLNWEKVTGKAVIPMVKLDETGRPYRVYDPCIWKDKDGYYSLSGTYWDGTVREDCTMVQHLFFSRNLRQWKYLGPFVEGGEFTEPGEDGAVPYFWPLADKHILLFASHKRGAQYLLGDYDRANHKFKPFAHGRFNFGLMGPGGVHAPTATPDGKGGVIVIFNMNPAKPTHGWNQLMSLPRRLTLTKKDELRIEPAGDIESLRYDHKHVNETTLKENQELVLENISGTALEIIAEIDPKNASNIVMDVLRSPHKEEFTRITFVNNRSKKEKSEISIDVSSSSILPDVNKRPLEKAPVFIDENEALKLQVFVDKSVLEVFVNERQCVAVRVYPSREDSIGVSLQSNNKDAVLKSLDAWQMRTIYKF